MQPLAKPRAAILSHPGTLWITDGTASGTVALGTYAPPGSLPRTPIDSTALGELIVFVGHDSTNGYEPWITDGTPGGTMLLKDIYPGSAEQRPYSLTSADELVYFRANDGTHGYELWRTDGTSEGTVMVKDINPGPEHFMPNTITYANGHLVFTANDGINGFELWVIPPGEAEPQLFKVAPAGTESNPKNLGMSAGPYEAEAAWHVKPKFNVLDDHLVLQAYHPDYGNDLWALPLGAETSAADWNLYY